MRRLISVKPLDNYEVELVYARNQLRHFDLKPYLNLGKFRELKNVTLFQQVRISFDTISWANGIDICPDLLYEKSSIVH